MVFKNGLHATYKDGKSHINAYLDDYAFLINSILNFLSVKWNNNLFDKAVTLSNILIEKFLDKENGGFFFTANDHENLIQKPKPTADEAFPSGNSIAARVLIKLGFLMNNTKYIDAASSTFMFASEQINNAPNAHSSFLDSYSLIKNPFILVIIKSLDKSKDAEIWLDKLIDLNKSYVDYYLITENNTGYANIDDKIVNNKTTAYICTNFSCEQPIYDIEEFISRINIL